MCVVSMVGDHYGQRIPRDYPWIQPYVFPSPTTNPEPYRPIVIDLNPPTREEFDRLKKDIENLKELLVKAKEYDKANNEPNCEMEEKIKYLKAVAKAVGVDLDEIFKPK